MSKFDAAIQALKDSAAIERQYVGIQSGRWVRQCEAAIRVLEEAAKVDKVDTLIAIDDSSAAYDEINAPSALERTGVRDLIFALPDKEA
jgi:hypothetical protein